MIVACPSNGADAVRLLRTCADLAVRQRRVVVFLEPIALYMTKDLHEKGDNAWLNVYPPLNETIPFGEVTITPGEEDCVVLTYGNGVYLTHQALPAIQKKTGKTPRIIDLHWLAPLPLEALLRACKQAQRVLIVDECRRSGSLSEALVDASVRTSAAGLVIRRLCAEDSFIPLGDAWQHVVPSSEAIAKAAIELF